jgi:hypothetical protein
MCGHCLCEPKGIQMSKHNGIRFCDKCLSSIPTGDMYHEDGKKDKCRKCNRKGSFVNLILSAFLMATLLMSGVFGYNKVDNRIQQNTAGIEFTAKYIVGLEGRLSETFRDVGRWADTVDSRLSRFYAENKEEAMFLKSMLDDLRQETSGILAAQNALRKDLSGGKMTNAKVANAISVLSARAQACEEQLQIIMRNPAEIIQKVIKPTVAIAVRDRKGDHLRGSGVLFRRELIRDTSNIRARVSYRYYGFTCYHVWDGVFKYLANINKDAIPEINPATGGLDKKLNPRLLVQYFDGNSRIAQFYISNGDFIHPTSVIKGYKPVQDIVVFTFISKRGDLAIADLASDAEIAQNVYYGSRIYTTGVAVGGVPSLYFGTTSNPLLPGNIGIGFQAFGFYGQSGGPIYDAKTLKIISLNQRVWLHGGGMMNGAIPLTNTIYGVTLNYIRIMWRASAPKEYKNILDAR